jgi:hypothetical protein
MSPVFSGGMAFSYFPATVPGFNLVWRSFLNETVSHSPFRWKFQPITLPLPPTRTIPGWLHTSMLSLLSTPRLLPLLEHRATRHAPHQTPHSWPLLLFLLRPTRMCARAWSRNPLAANSTALGPFRRLLGPFSAMSADAFLKVVLAAMSLPEMVGLVFTETLGIATRVS